MRIACEVILDKAADSPMGNEGQLAEQIDEEFLPAPGQRVYISGDEGETEYVVTSSRAWAEDMQPEMTERQMTAPMDAAMSERQRKH